MNGFGELLATRIIFACAQATQNPICFSLIPELFRKDRTTAMAAYNSAIYMGRALSFAAVIVAGKLGMAKATGDIGVTMVQILDCFHIPVLQNALYPILFAQVCLKIEGASVVVVKHRLKRCLDCRCL